MVIIYLKPSPTRCMKAAAGPALFQCIHNMNKKLPGGNHCTVPPPTCTTHANITDLKEEPEEMSTSRRSILRKHLPQSFSECRNVERRITTKKNGHFLGLTNPAVCKQQVLSQISSLEGSPILAKAPKPLMSKVTSLTSSGNKSPL